MLRAGVIFFSREDHPNWLCNSKCQFFLCFLFVSFFLRWSHAKLSRQFLQLLCSPGGLELDNAAECEISDVQCYQKTLKILWLLKGNRHKILLWYMLISTFMDAHNLRRKFSGLGFRNLTKHKTSKKQSYVKILVSIKFKEN